MQPFYVFFFICISRNEALLLYKYKYMLYIKKKKTPEGMNVRNVLNYFKHYVWPHLVHYICDALRMCLFFFNYYKYC